MTKKGKFWYGIYEFLCEFGKNLRNLKNLKEIKRLKDSKRTKEKKGI